jgi:hypothetical protein
MRDSSNGRKGRKGKKSQTTWKSVDRKSSGHQYGGDKSLQVYPPKTKQHSSKGDIASASFQNNRKPVNKPGQTRPPLGKTPFNKYDPISCVKIESFVSDGF